MANKNKNTPVAETVTGVNTEAVTQIVGTPVVETPVVETPIVVTPVVETPVVETPIVVTPVVETPVVETPIVVTPVVVTPVVETPVVETTVIDAEIIPSGTYVAENGNEFEFTVGSFVYQGKKYTKEEALADHSDVLEHLISLKSFILKKK